MQHGGRRLSAALTLTAAVAVGACASTTVRSIGKEGGPQSFKIECMELDGCLSEAARACHGPYRTVSTQRNGIAESDLPGLNARTQSQGVSTHGPGIESSEPMPLTAIIVVCSG